MLSLCLAHRAASSVLVQKLISVGPLGKMGVFVHLERTVVSPQGLCVASVVRLLGFT